MFHCLIVKHWFKHIWHRSPLHRVKTVAIRIPNIPYSAYSPVKTSVWQKINTKNILKISFGGIPNSRNVLFLQIFLKRAGKPNAGNSADFPRIKWSWPGLASATFSGTRRTWLGCAPRFPRTFSGTFSGTLLNLTWLCTKASQTFSETLLNLTWLCTKASQTFSGTLSGTLLNLTWLCSKTSRSLLRNVFWNLLQNPVEPDLVCSKASHTFTSGTLLNLTWLCTKASPTFSGTFSGTPLNLTWLCTKASRRTWPGSAPRPFPEPCWTWPVSAPKPHRPSPEPSSEPCWTWLGSAPKPPRPSPEPSPEPRWTWLGFAPRLPGEPDLALHQGLFRNPVEPDLSLHQSHTDLLRNLLRNPVEPDPTPAPVHTGAIPGWRPH